MKTGLPAGSPETMIQSDSIVVFGRSLLFLFSTLDCFDERNIFATESGMAAKKLGCQNTQFEGRSLLFLSP
ncbi:hypothetical protein [Salicola sp. Rm-C-2C1-2]|uniref:hypothetical protein n=1 Tax=Salicola sp. Rm-C-2C1-2 TaxID=3141321 RepID=UPI0032E426CF